jgi:threonine dehydrogenase-like Zn-dependent dehydrogenase
MITAQLYSPSTIIMIDMDHNRLKVAKRLGAHHTIDPKDGNAEEAVKVLTDGKGCDTVIEAVGVPKSFELCQILVAPGGVIANVGVHGTKVDLHLENLWAQNVGKSPSPLSIKILIICSNHNPPSGHSDNTDASEARALRKVRPFEADYPQ